ncbi:MAG: phosphatidylglycerol lysyltransferase domain-containing protein, partial [Armatimonadota bacterium]|nr:phosphatidylglycerol lysyltransferase domain-containing protein [Armatimonadota bacterium]
MIKTFPEWGEIELEDQSTFAEFARREEPVSSEMSFANLFVWRHSYNFRLSVLGNALCVLAGPDGKEPFFLPPIAPADPVATTLDLFAYLKDKGHNPSMLRAPEGFVGKLKATNSEAPFEVKFDRDNSDYVYLASDLMTLAGRKYHKKRNQIAQFRAKYDYEYRRIMPDLLPQCIALQQAWCNLRDCFIPENTSLAEEHVAAMEALDNFETLGLVGGAILIDGKVEAFTIGGRLNHDTMVIHFEKGNPSFPGIYQVVNQAFCADTCAGYTYVNREQDLGDPGLRQAKKSYYPHCMI